MYVVYIETQCTNELRSQCRCHFFLTWNDVQWRRLTWWHVLYWRVKTSHDFIHRGINHAHGKSPKQLPILVQYRWHSRQGRSFQRHVARGDKVGESLCRNMSICHPACWATALTTRNHTSVTRWITWLWLRLQAVTLQPKLWKFDLWWVPVQCSDDTDDPDICSVDNKQRHAYYA